jgi:formylglycine-generating enzyme required for sulfatase activity
MKPNAASPHLLLIAMATALALLPAVEARRQNNRLLTVEEIKQLPAKAKRFALVVGVDEYQDSQISRLSGATNDAKSLADALVRYAGFPQDQVILLASDQPQERQPNRGNILKYLSNLRGVVPEDGLLLVSFAGHGIERGGRGFLCPLDAQIGGSIALLEATAVAVDTVREWIRDTGVKQVLIILDACRNDPSGRGESENKLTDSFAKKFNFDLRNQEVTAFATLYATDVGHVAYEYKEKHQGYFTWMLVEGLKGAAANERGEVTLGGLVKYLQEQVPKRIRLDLGQEKSQKPYATVGGYKADELVISIMVRITPDKSAATIDAGANEREFWSSIKGSNDPEDFKVYLEKYPNGDYVGLARNALRRLEAATKSASPTVNPPATNPVGTPPVSTSAGKQEKVELQTYTETAGGAAIEMVRVPSGRFTMGSPDSDTGALPKEMPQHTVSISSFYMGKYEVTQTQWRAVARLPKVKLDLNPDPSSFKASRSKAKPRFNITLKHDASNFKDDNLPVETVSWEEAIEFCDRLSRATGKTYHLPTEAEWEYAARAMTTEPYAGTLDEMGWYGNNAGRMRVDANEIALTDGSNYSKRITDNGNQTHAVGQKRPNRFGLYDMHGNVWEWCMDWYGENYYAQSPSADPTGPSTGSYRVRRGGGWDDIAMYLRSANRDRRAPDFRSGTLGFRLTRTYN